MSSVIGADPWFQDLFAERIGGKNYGKDTKIYKFEKIKRAKRAALAAHPERLLLDFGIGENDDMAAPVVRESLKKEVDLNENRGYADNGIADYKQAAAEFMDKVFGVKLDPVTEINHAIGSKPAYAMLPGIFINPGDVTLMTVPGYPVARKVLWDLHARLAGRYAALDESMWQAKKKNQSRTLALSREWPWIFHPRNRLEELFLPLLQ